MARTAEQKTDIAFAELDVVKTRVTISANGHLYPSGSRGAIVLVHRDGRAFEVELPDPYPAVVTLEASEIELAQ